VVINRIAYYISQGRVETPSRIDGQFCCSFVANLLLYLCAKNYQNTMRFDKVIAKIEGCIFLPQSVVLWVSNIPAGGLNTGGVYKFRDFRPINRYRPISQTIQDSAIVTVECEYETAPEWYQFQWPWVTSNPDSSHGVTIDAIDVAYCVRSWRAISLR